jgi:hypothetical protein
MSEGEGRGLTFLGTFGKRQLFKRLYPRRDVKRIDGTLQPAQLIIVLLPPLGITLHTLLHVCLCLCGFRLRVEFVRCVIGRFRFGVFGGGRHGW